MDRYRSTTIHFVFDAAADAALAALAALAAAFFEAFLDFLPLGEEAIFIAMAPDAGCAAAGAGVAAGAVA